MIKAAIEKIEQMARANTFFFGDEIYADRKLYRLDKEQLADPALASDFEKLMEIQAEIDQNEKQQEDLLNLLVEAEEELTTL